MSVAGTDATESFNDIGHSEDAQKQLSVLLVGVVEGVEVSSVAVSVNKLTQIPLKSPNNVDVLDAPGGKAFDLFQNRCNNIDRASSRIDAICA